MPHSVVHKGRKSVSAAVLGDVVIEEQDNWALRGRWDLIEEERMRGHFHHREYLT